MFSLEISCVLSAVFICNLNKNNMPFLSIDILSDNFPKKHYIYIYIYIYKDDQSMHLLR